MPKSSKSKQEKETLEDVVVEEEVLEESNEDVVEETSVERDEDLNVEDVEPRDDDKVSELEAEIKTLKEAELRAFAELENFKRRKEQEKSDFIKFSNEKVIMDILPVFDAFDMALMQSEQSDEKAPDALMEGLQLIKKQMASFLDKLNVTRIEAIDQEFDPNLHQAIKKEAKEGVDSNIVIYEMQAGYRLNDRVIRPSMVVVSE